MMNNVSADVNAAFRRLLGANPDLAEAVGFQVAWASDGEARQRLWNCDDAWIVGYTTERITGGDLEGKFAVMAYRPQGPGARSGRTTAKTEWVRVYFRGFATRKGAKERATTLYYRHSLKTARRHGVSMRQEP
jgi:hypothetical protein